MQETLLAFVAKAVNYKDHDRILTLITRERGIVTASAHGCRKPQSRLMPCSQVFCYGEYVLTERKGKLYITSCDLREIFYNLRLSYETLTAAYYIVAVCTEFANVEMEFKKQFSLLLNCVKHLCDTANDKKLVISFFIAKLMSFEGYAPQTDACVLCETSKMLNYFSEEDGGAVCVECAKEISQKRRISTQTLKKIKTLCEMPTSAFDLLKDNTEDIRPVYEILTDFLSKRVTCKLPAI